MFRSSCAACGGKLAPFRREWLRRCGDCGTLHSSFEPDIPEAARESAIDEGRRARGLDALRAANNERLLAAIGRRVARGGRLLDVGSGPGFLLRQAAAKGFAALGVEPDANVAPEGVPEGVKVRRGMFPDVLAAEETFDAIVFNDTLEHIPDTRAALTAAYAHLGPGGVLCLNCPDRRGFFFRIAAALDRVGWSGPYDRMWQRGLPSPHVWYFTPDALARAAQACGFQEVGRVGLDAVYMKGLWERLRFVRAQSVAGTLAVWLFAVLSRPLLWAAPRDSVASLFVKR